MKNTILVAVLSMISIYGFGQKNGTAEIITKTKIYCDHSGACEDCKPNIVSSVENLSAVKAADLNN